MVDDAVQVIRVICSSRDDDREARSDRHPVIDLAALQMLLMVGWTAVSGPRILTRWRRINPVNPALRNLT
jgi:hypothetical protein